MESDLYGEQIRDDVRHRLDLRLRAQWDADPGHVVITDGAESVTAGELRDRAGRLAVELRARGIGPGDRVAVHLERSTEFLVGVLGIILAGAAHAALDVDDPVERTRLMLDDCGPRLIVTSEALSIRLGEEVQAPILTVEEYSSKPPHGPPPPAAELADQPAVVLYTSGSTGRPKASLISHRAVATRLDSLQRTHTLGKDDRMVHHTSCSFDMFLIETYWPLLAGARVVIAEPGRQRDAEYLGDLLRDHEITSFYCVVSLLELFMLAQQPDAKVGSVRQVLTGGEPLSPRTVRRFHSSFTASLTNLYGPSECTIYCTAWECPPDPEIVLIGSAIDDTTLWILDEKGDPVPDGTPGELYVGGDGLALGYLDRPELTAERFVTDRLGGSAGRLYRSGDLVRRRPDGDLEFLGRVDRQVKVRGFRIELGEIEAVALRSPLVRQIAVVADGSGSTARLVAFVVPGEPAGESSLTAALRAELRALLPSYMLPAVISEVEHLPLTANGKLDRLQLEAWAATAVPATTAGGAAPKDDMEPTVAAVWNEILGLEAIGRHDDFFEIGGDSMKAVLATRRLAKVLGVRIPMRLLFRHTTLAAFAGELAERQRMEMA